MTMIIDLSFILFNIFQPSDYSISLLLLAKSSIPTSIRGDSSSAISVKFELYAFDAELQKKNHSDIIYTDYLMEKNG